MEQNTEHRPLPSGEVTGRNAHPPSRIRRAIVGVTVVVVLTLVGVGGWSAYAAQQRNDQYQLMLLGECVASGGRMYVDCWENKPPGIAWINALAIATTGGRQLGAWIAPPIVLLLALTVFARWTYHVSPCQRGSFRNTQTGSAPNTGPSPTNDARRSTDESSDPRRMSSTIATCLAVVLAAGVFTLRVYDTPSINPDFYSAACELIAGCLFWRAMTASRLGWLRALIAGVVWSAALATKVTGVVSLCAFTAVGLVVLFLGGRAKRRWMLRLIGAWVGCTVGVGCMVAVLYERGTLGQAIEAAYTFNKELTGWDHLRSALLTWHRAVDGLSPLQAPLWLAAIGVIAAWRMSGPGRATRSSESPPDASKREASPPRDESAVHDLRPLTAALVLWWMLQTVLALIGPSLAMRYWQATMPPMLLSASLGVTALVRTYGRITPRYRSPFVICAITAGFLLLAPMVDHYQTGLAATYLAYSDGDAERQRLNEIAEAVRDRIAPGERIYVWAYDAGVYVHARRLPASRFTYPRSQAQMDEILTDLESGRARAILIPETTTSWFRRWCDDRCDERLAKRLAACPAAGTVGGYTIHLCAPSR